MKQYLSIMGLFIRSSIYRILGVLAAMAVVEAAVFHYSIQKALRTAAEGMTDLSLDGCMDMKIWLLCMAAFLVVTVLLYLPGCSFSTRTDYTLGRLACSEREIFLAQAVVNLLFYLLFWAVQVLVIFGLCRYYAYKIPDSVTSQTVFLAFYHSAFLHALLPLAEWKLWIRNLLLLLALSVSAADFSRRQRRSRRFTGVAAALACFTVLFFNCRVGNMMNVLLVSGVAVLILAGTLIRNLCAEGEEKDG